MLNGYIKSIGNIKDKPGNLVEEPKDNYGHSADDIFMLE